MLMNLFSVLAFLLKAKHLYGFMDNSPRCDRLFPAAAGRIEDYRQSYRQFLFDKILRHATPRVRIDEAAISFQRFYDRCGEMASSPDMIDGVVTQNGLTWPWLVGFVSDSGCFGNYISPKWILTTSSCIKTNLVKLRRPNYARSRDIIYISNFILHDGYDRSSDANDVALIHVPEEDYVRPGCLPLTGGELAQHASTRCFLTAYESLDKLRVFQWKVAFGRSDRCRSVMANYSLSPETHTCVFPLSPNKDILECVNGWVGLPVNCYSGFAWHIVAVTSPRQIPCRKDGYSEMVIVTNVTIFVDWVRENSQKIF
ncbi:hypothetical protein Btru_047074 [Bulinus truncatus]|nr:hypothetical protein Btru_047074 [Bulinus truncatus]